jgi:hypothetical protein
MHVCSICGDGVHKVANCPELWHPEKVSGGGGGGHDHDDDDERITATVITVKL